MRRQDEQIVPVLDHAHREAQCEALGQGVEVAEHCVAPYFPQQSDPVFVDSRHEEWHDAAHAHGAHTDLFLGEANLGTCNGKCSLEGLGAVSSTH